LIKNSFDVKGEGSSVNRVIRRALLFLRSLGLITYEERLINNLKGAAIPCFKLQDVGYYIDYNITEINGEIEDEDLKDIIERIKCRVDKK